MRNIVIRLLITFILTACSGTQVTEPIPPATLPATSTTTSTPLPSLLPTSTSVSTPQPHLLPVKFGPDDFPSNINPLTGRAVLDPSLLDLPAVLVSVSNSPASARPQAGPGFAPWVFELFIGEGVTRFMNVFYGDYPRDVPNIVGDCAVREEIINPNGGWIGNRIWFDENTNGIQDDWEMGVGGVCVHLLGANDRKVLQETSTDSNGYYAFENPGNDIIIQFGKPPAYQFTQADIGDEDHDSDADETTGETPVIQSDATVSSWDAGLVLSDNIIPTPNPSATATPSYIPTETYVGPIRSGRLTYNQIGGMFPNSCLVYASATWDIGEMLDACEIVFGVDLTTPNSALMTISRMRELAEDNLNPKQRVNYTGNLFSDEIPDGGVPASFIDVYYHSFNQSAWTYDPIAQSYLRHTDDADGKGILHPATDRLTERQLQFENVIVVLAEHMRFRHNQLEVDFGNGQGNFAYLFRDGQVFRIRWATTNREYEKSSGLRRPMHFIDAQGNLVPLHPGRTWIHIVTPFSTITNTDGENWRVKFVPPLDPPDTPVP
ncbi:MAG TPA: SdrD B-like domain-containing protein [Anaerolineales bacterium]|nr:SdrD B-like domain-containing protein [Anaerolineales bacterium]